MILNYHIGIISTAAILVFVAAPPAGALDVGKTAKSVTESLSGGDRSRTSKSSHSTKSGDSHKSGKSGGINVKVGTNLLGGAKVKANVLGKNGVANVEASTGALDTKAKAEVLSKRGVANVKVKTDLLNTRVKLNVLSDNQVANLGVTIGGNGSGNSGGNGGGNQPTVNGGVLGGMSDGQIAALKLRCVDILGQPQGYDRQLVELCAILQRI